MIGIVVVAHGDLAGALLAAAEHVVGPLPNARAVAIGPNDDLRRKSEEISRAMAEVDSGDGLVLIADMFGGTPANLALAASAEREAEVLCGANLPLLVKLAKMRERPLAEAVSAALETGHKYLTSASRILDPAAQR